MSVAAHLLGQGALRASLEAVLQLRQADDTDRAFVADAHEFASEMSLHGHRRDYGDPHAGGHHRYDSRKLAALEDHIRAHPRSAARRKRIFPEAMAFLEQKKRIFAKLAERQRSSAGKAMAVRQG